ncbi:hypothetical protein EUX98_g9136 [Antrodiella citrinella]|uniref:Uncharacterized protein n=1 Tax=Antrodiella citrinella TaxID=2447956 RepID=A0A4S4LZK3_9APHY|nr:hypothetical protein EUX98_g9136 [Antrodiella citrinella]
MEPLTTAGSVDFDDNFMDAEDAVLVEGQLGVNEVTAGSSSQQQQYYRAQRSEKTQEIQELRGQMAQQSTQMKEEMQQMKLQYEGWWQNFQAEASQREMHLREREIKLQEQETNLYTMLKAQQERAAELERTGAAYEDTMAHMTQQRQREIRRRERQHSMDVSGDEPSTLSMPGSLSPDAPRRPAVVSVPATARDPPHPPGTGSSGSSDIPPRDPPSHPPPTTTPDRDRMALLRTVKAAGRKLYAPPRLLSVQSNTPSTPSSSSNPTQPTAAVSGRDSTPTPTSQQQTSTSDRQPIPSNTTTTPTRSRKIRPRKRPTMAEEQLKIEKELMPKKDHNEFLLLVRKVCKTAFKIEQDVDFLLHDPPSASDIIKFYDDTGPGPQAADLRLDVMGNPKSRWNKIVAGILLQAVQVEAGNTTQLPSDAYMMSLIIQRLDNLKKAWRAKLPRTRMDGTIEDEDEAYQRLEDTVEKTKRSTRHRTRRCAKWERRMKIVDGTIRIKDKDGDNDLCHWEWLREVLSKLTQDGMSSEDTDDEDTLVPTYKTKTLQWRRAMHDALQIIDEGRRANLVVFNPQGSKPRPRHQRGEVILSERPPVPDLPEQLYDEGWLKSLSEDEMSLVNPVISQWKWNELVKV